MGTGQPESWECRDCGSTWAESQAKKCLHCSSEDIFIFWNPKTHLIPKPKRIQLKTKRIQLKAKNHGKGWRLRG